MVGGGFGLITSSDFFVPQVNRSGSMANFVTPVGVTAAIRVPLPANSGGYSGLGQSASVRTDSSWVWLPLLALGAWLMSPRQGGRSR